MICVYRKAVFTVLWFSVLVLTLNEQHALQIDKWCVLTWWFYSVQWKTCSIHCAVSAVPDKHWERPKLHWIFGQDSTDILWSSPTTSTFTRSLWYVKCSHKIHFRHLWIQVIIIFRINNLYESECHINVKFSADISVNPSCDQ